MNDLKQRQTIARAELGTKLRELFEAEEARGVSKSTIFRRAGMNPSSFRKFMCGKENIRLDTLVKLAAACGRHVRYEFPHRISTTKAINEERRYEPELPPPSDVHALIARVKIPPLAKGQRRHRRHGDNFTARTIKNVLHAVAETGFEWVGYREFAEMAGVSPAIINDLMPVLANHRLVEVQKRPKEGTALGAGRSRYLVRTETLRGIILGTMTIGGSRETESCGVGEAGRLLGVSRQAVEKCEKRALRKLEQALRPARGEEVRDG